MISYLKSYFLISAFWVLPISLLIVTIAWVIYGLDKSIEESKRIRDEVDADLEAHAKEDNLSPRTRETLRRFLIRQKKQELKNARKNYFQKVKK